MTDDARDQFCRREKNIHHQSGESGAQAALEAVGLHAELLTTKHPKDMKEFFPSSSFSSSSSIFGFDYEDENDDEDD